MSETTSTIIQTGALGILLLYMGFSIRFLAKKLENTEKALQDLENALLREAGLPQVKRADDPKLTDFN